MDDLDRQIAAALQANGRASWLQVSQVVGSSESTVARRAQRMMESGELRVVAVADTVRCGFGYPVLMQVNYEAGAASNVARTLAARPDVRFLAIVTGSFDIVLEMIVPSRRYLAQVLTEELPRIEGIEETTTETVLRNFKMSYDWSRSLLGDTSTEPLRSVDAIESGAGQESKPLDAVDLTLYELLLEDGRRSFAELAALSGVSESRCRRRVERLIGGGYIKFAVLIEPYLLGYDMECFCWVRVHLSQMEETAQALAELPQVRYLSATIGHSDMICEAIFRSQDELYEFSTGTLGRLAGVKSVDIGVELQTVKRAYRIISLPGERTDYEFTGAGRTIDETNREERF